MPKIMLHDDEARQALGRGVAKLARAVRGTLGPRGMNAIIDRPIGTPIISRDGVSIAAEIELEDPFENMGAQVLREVSKQTNEIAGDGTTTATVLAEAIFKEGFRAITSGADAMAVARGVRKAVEAVVADLKKALSMLNKAARKLIAKPRKNEAIEQEIAKFKTDFQASNKPLEESTQFPMSPQRILADLRAAAPADALIVTDVGWNKNGIGQQFSFYTADTFITPGGLATMGFGVPGAMGVKIGAPDKTVIAVVGDGGFGQNPAVLASIAVDNVAIVIVIMNNNAFGTIAGLIKAHYDTTFGTVFFRDGVEYAPDYAGIAQNYGIEGVTIERAEDFKPALEKAIKANRPVLLDVRMVNIPTPTEGHWDIMSVFSPGKTIHHVSTT